MKKFTTIILTIVYTLFGIIIHLQMNLTWDIKVLLFSLSTFLSTVLLKTTCKNLNISLLQIILINLPMCLITILAFIAYLKDDTLYVLYFSCFLVISFSMLAVFLKTKFNWSVYQAVLLTFIVTIGFHYQFNQIIFKLLNFEKSPDIEFPELRPSIKNIKKPIILHFWNLSCQSCIEDFEHYDKFAKNHKNIEIINVLVKDRSYKESTYKRIIERYPTSFSRHLELDIDRSSTFFKKLSIFPCTLGYGLKRQSTFVFYGTLFKPWPKKMEAILEECTQK